MNLETKNKHQGFTLLELLIVIAIIAVLSVALVFVLNPAETLKKSRDAQRISDLSAIKTALGLYTTSVNPIYLGGTASNATCRDSAGAWTSADRIYYSYPSDSPGAAITDATLDGGSASAPASSQVVNANLALTDGTGWVPVNLDNISGGSPISNLPIDPSNTIPTAALTAMDNTALVYRYACRADNLTSEFDVPLESTAYTVDDNKLTKDGGNNSSFYEVGSNLKILGSGNNF